MSCPSETELLDLCKGGSNSESANTITAHLDQCALCQKKIDDIVSSMSEMLRKLREKPLGRDSELLRKKIENLKIQRPKQIGDATVVKDREQRLAKSPMHLNEIRGGLRFFTAIALIAFVAAVLLPVNKNREPAVMVARNANELLKIASEDHGGNTIIQLVANQEYVFGPIDLAQKSIEIRGDDERKPTLMFQLDSNEIGIQCDNTHLKLSGVLLSVDENWETEDEEIQAEALVSCRLGRLILNNCSIRSDMRPCIDLVSSNCQMKDAELVTDGHALVSRPESSSRLEIESSRFVAETGLGFPSSARGSLKIIDSKFEGNFAIELPYRENNPVSINASGCKFVCDGGAISIFAANRKMFGMQESELVKLLPIRWTGENNQIVGIPTLLSIDENTTRRLSWPF